MEEEHIIDYGAARGIYTLVEGEVGNGNLDFGGVSPIPYSPKCDGETRK